MLRRLLENVVDALEREPIFRYALISGITALIVLSFVGPDLEIEWPVVGLVALILAIFYFPTITRIVLPGNIEIHRQISEAGALTEASIEAETARPAEQPEKDQGQPSEARTSTLERPDDTEEKLLRIFNLSPIAARWRWGAS